MRVRRFVMTAVVSAAGVFGTVATAVTAAEPAAGAVSRAVDEAVTSCCTPAVGNSHHTSNQGQKEPTEEQKEEPKEPVEPVPARD